MVTLTWACFDSDNDSLGSFVCGALGRLFRLSSKVRRRLPEPMGEGEMAQSDPGGHHPVLISEPSLALRGLSVVRTEEGGHAVGNWSLAEGASIPPFPL